MDRQDLKYALFLRIGKEEIRLFREAAVCFKKVLTVLPSDQPAKLLLNKIGSYLVDGVPEDWTGVLEMKTK